ncbi:hypothetical protein Q5762_09925 [Streptomyces sp. P9(2023)]|uniref:hypothetical protein n=1 Tax=Streptomyces sp. P9(2023) TaxID=3064394 RepID=UPI0028F4170E|nr:hypothetical protein [Streptomyces sp. P9(2023)]MDT9688667.1 hypothetical protein [Streptomyces sp. P9(2023)]
MTRARRPAVGLAMAGALLLPGISGCASSVDPIERLGRKTAVRVFHTLTVPDDGPTTARRR